MKTRPFNVQQPTGAILAAIGDLVGGSTRETSGVGASLCGSLTELALALRNQTSSAELERIFKAVPAAGFSTARYLISRLLQDKQVKSALEYLMQYNPDDLVARQSIDYAVYLACCGRERNAECIVRKAYSLDESLRDGYARIGAEHYAVVGQHDTALECMLRDWDAGRLSANQLFPLLKQLALHDRLREAMDMLEDAYSHYPGLCDGFAAVGQYYQRVRNHGPALQCLLRDYDAHRLSSRRIGQLAVVLSCNARTDEALQIVEKNYSVNPELAGCFAAMGWERCITGHYREAWELVSRDMQADRLPDRLLWQYAAIAFCQGNYTVCRSVLNGIETKGYQKHFYKFVTGLYMADKIDQRALTQSLAMLESALENGEPADAGLIEQNVRQHYYTGEGEKALKILDSWEQGLPSKQRGRAPRAALACSAALEGDKEYAEALLKCIQPEDIHTQRAFLMYLPCAAILDDTDSLQLALKVFKEQYCYCFMHSPAACLMIAVPAWKFGDAGLFEKCLRIGMQATPQLASFGLKLREVARNIRPEPRNMPLFPLPEAAAGLEN